MFKRKYQYICSSHRCPSKSPETSLHENVVSDMTLHEPKRGAGLILVRSIKEWEVGSSEQALISCKEIFSQEPHHSEDINQIDHGRTIVRCSGWHQVSNISFLGTPPFLILDIAALFHD